MASLLMSLCSLVSVIMDKISKFIVFFTKPRALRLIILSCFSCSIAGSLPVEDLLSETGRMQDGVDRQFEISDDLLLSALAGASWAETVFPRRFFKWYLIVRLFTTYACFTVNV